MKIHIFFKIILTLFFFIIISSANLFAQHENKNWYFGTGTDGIIFDANNNPVKVSNKYPGLGYEGNVVVSDPFNGELLFYTDGINVINKNHALMNNGTGLLANYSGAQCVQACRVPDNCDKYFIISNSSYDNVAGNLYSSIVDFSTNPLGTVANKNQFINGPNYHQGMRIIPKSNSNNYWLIGHLYNTATYHVFEITSTGFVGPVVYNFSNTGKSWGMKYNSKTHKLLHMGEGNLKVTLFDFNPATGVLSNETQLASGSIQAAWVGNFSPDGTKIYVGVTPGYILWQYDLNSGIWTNMNTCCYSHDVQTGPNGITYFIHTYNSTNPLAQILDANQSAIGNACGYSAITNPGNFNGNVRRFSEFLISVPPPIANTDTLTVNSGSTVNVFPLLNDSDPQNDPISLDSILIPSQYGSIIINGNQIQYNAISTCTTIIDSILYKISDSNCSYDTAYIVITIPGTGLNINAAFNFQTTICSPTVIFNNLSSPATNYNWNFGDGSNSTTFNPVHTYSTAGTYNVTLVVSDNCSSDSISYQVNISTAIIPDAQFTYEEQSCGTTSINFSNVSINGNNFEWNFGDGQTDTSFESTHFYSNPGNYNVMLIAFNLCTSDTLSHMITIDTPAVGVAQFDWKIYSCSPEVQFINNSQNASTFVWEFGDGNISTLSDPNHVYDSGGIYQVQLVINESDICADSVLKTIDLSELNNELLFVPNCFTPNNDGLNDLFEIKGSTICSEYSIDIYNRWGQIVYSGNKATQFWNGTKDNIKCPDGVYYFLIKSGIHTKQGTISLFR